MSDTTCHKSVLVIDDDEANRRVLAKLLLDVSIQPVLAGDGKTGLELARRCPPDLILLDLFMPGEDGFDVLDQIQQDPKLKSIPVIICSILEREESRQKALYLGARDYCVKPFNMDHIIDCIKSHL